MSSFEIDLGTDRPRNLGALDVVNIMADAAYDAAGPDASAEEVGMELCKLIAARLWASKKPETVRRHFCNLWPIIAPLATTAPDAFDAILTEFAERASDFR